MVVVPEPVTDCGLKVACGPPGLDVMEKSTCWLNPPEGVTVTE